MASSPLCIFALISLLLSTVHSAGGSQTTEDHSNDSSHQGHRRAARAHPFGHQITGKTQDQGILDSSTYLKLSKDSDPVSIEDETYYICISGTCDNVKVKVIKSSDPPCSGDDKVFLVNKDNFEMLEWNTWADIHKGQIPVKPLVICKELYITKEKQGIVSNLKHLFKKTDISTEILTLNTDIRLQHLQIDSYNTTKEKLSTVSEMIKFVKAENRDCKSAKHVVKLDQGSDRLRSFLKGRTLTSGKAKEFSVSGKIPQLEVSLGGKYSVKYDESHLTSETVSRLDKVLSSVSVEVEVPPNHSCSVDISSETIYFHVPYSGQLLRVYGNHEERTTSIADTYDHQEVVDLLTFVNACTPLPDGTKCSKT